MHFDSSTNCDNMYSCDSIIRDRSRVLSVLPVYGDISLNTTQEEGVR